MNQLTFADLPIYLKLLLRPHSPSLLFRPLVDTGSWLWDGAASCDANIYFICSQVSSAHLELKTGTSHAGTSLQSFRTEVGLLEAPAVVKRRAL